MPAGILQPPHFTVGGGSAANYGAIGAIIGHEVSHALDLSASGVGTRSLVAQMDGALAQAEMFADLGGLAIAHRAYRRRLNPPRTERRFIER